MRYIITHGHIFKNAGSTVDNALKKTFGNDFVDHRDDHSMKHGGADYLKQYLLDNPNIKAISSHHLCNPLPESESFKCIPIYFVRNPIERVVSVYNFEKKQKRGTLGAEKASQLSLIDYVKWRLEDRTPKVISNYQTTYIGCDRKMKPGEKVTITDFFNTLEKIKKQQILIGIVEEFDLSWQRIVEELNKFLHTPIAKYEIKNRSNTNTNLEKYESALKKLAPVLPELLNENLYDILLHQYAYQLIHSK